MSLSVGTRLGPYEILSPLGAGGMGEVYKARDTRLDRAVAIKILGATLAGDPQFKDRLDREARAISQLTHPHICTLHDVGEHDGTAFLVMELLDGETLADRLKKGALPVDEALKIGIQIADALDAAHRHDMVHRDLKPGNVMLTKGGAKLLDFGLAKASGHAIADAGLSMLSTTPPDLTAQGTILGTFQYMAPEQLEGQNADARTDIFGFGAVLYEMLTGRKAFDGKSQASLIAAIIHATPELVSKVQPLAPAALDHIVRTCLAKDPDDRWQSARDLMRELKWIADAGVSLGSAARIPSAVGSRSGWSRTLAWAPGIAAVVFAIAGLALWVRSPAPPTVAPGTLRFLLADQLPAISEELFRSFAISPDGRRVVYAAVSGGVRRLYIRDMQTLEAKPIVGTETGTDPFFAPDGKRLGFWAEGALKVIGIEGGSPVTLVQGAADRGATWTPDDTIIYSPGPDVGLFRVAATGGTPQVVAKPDGTKRERSYRWPQILPGGDAVLFTIAGSDILSFDEARIAVRSLRTGEQHELLRGGSFPAYAAPGYLLYARAGALQAVRFNPAKTAIEGTPAAVLNGVATYPSNGAAQYAISSDGTLLYMRGGAVSTRTMLEWVDRTGRSTPLSVPPAPYQALSISPDGRFAALDIDAANASIWILEFARTTLNRLTLEWSNNWPFWTPDGARIAFLSSRAGVQSLFWQPIEGHAEMEPLAPDSIAGDFSPDGRTLALEGSSPNRGEDVWTMSMDANHQTRPFVQTKFNEGQPRFSPNSRWLAYVSDETGRNEVYVQPFPGPGRRVRISTDGGEAPIWSRDGREVFYLSGAELMAVKVSAGAVDLSPQKPERLFRKNRCSLCSGLEYDVAPDGRFLMIQPLEGTVPSAPIAVVLNWSEELKARVPMK